VNLRGKESTVRTPSGGSGKESIVERFPTVSREDQRDLWFSCQQGKVDTQLLFKSTGQLRKVLGRPKGESSDVERSDLAGARGRGGSHLETRRKTVAAYVVRREEGKTGRLDAQDSKGGRSVLQDSRNYATRKALHFLRGKKTSEFRGSGPTEKGDALCGENGRGKEKAGLDHSLSKRRSRAREAAANMVRRA